MRTTWSGKPCSASLQFGCPCPVTVTPYMDLLPGSEKMISNSPRVRVYFSCNTWSCWFATGSFQILLGGPLSAPDFGPVLWAPFWGRPGDPEMGGAPGPGWTHASVSKTGPTSLGRGPRADSLCEASWSPRRVLRAVSCLPHAARQVPATPDSSDSLHSQAHAACWIIKIRTRRLRDFMGGGR